MVLQSLPRVYLENSYEELVKILSHCPALLWVLPQSAERLAGGFLSSSCKKLSLLITWTVK